jgi:branched-chain amino acid transport system substrate-binding protein
MKRNVGALLSVLMILALVLSACAAPTPATAPEPAKAEPTKAVEPTKAPEPTKAEVKAAAIKVVLATDAAFPPMEFVDANKAIVGFDVDMMNAIAKAMGLEVEYKNTAWDGIFAGLESGGYDGIISSVTITDERKAKYDFSDPYINAGQAVVVLASEAAIKSDKDLPGKTVGAQIGTTGALAVEKISGATLKEYDTIDLAFADLVNGVVQAVVVDTPVAADYALTSDQFKGKLKIVGQPFTEEFYGILVRKGEQKEFLAAFNEGLKKIKADGTYDKIYAQWISGGTQIAGVAAAPAAAGATVAKAPGFPVKIGLAFPLSGDVKTFGESSRDGVLMAVEEAKAAGWQIETVLADSKCDAQEASNAANKLIAEDKVKYIIGEVCSSASIPISQIVNEAKVLQISPTSTNPAVTVNEDGSVKPYTFRACFLDPFQGEVVAALAKELGAKKAAVLFDVGNDYVKGLAEYFKASFEKMGGQVPVYEAYTKDDTDFSGILGKVAAANVDVVFLPDYYNKNNLIAAQIKEKGIKATLLGGDGWDSPELKFDLFEGGYHSNHYSPADPRPLVQNFVAAYQAKYGAVPDALATLAYDAAKILLQSISEAGADDPTAVAAKMEKIKYDGVSGDITFDEHHDPIKKAAIIKIQGGKPTFYKFVAP